MAFSSPLFLYGFMPVFFALYYLLPDRYKNGLILVGSLLFYSAGAGSAVLTKTCWRLYGFGPQASFGSLVK
jgi:alginate O-acetyltransferase complex protein AlgI